jgi:uncharacterized protein (TIGR00661 family)
MKEDRPLVIYALASMGMGHAVRAEPVIAHLQRRYRVHVFCGGPAHDHLAARFAEVRRIHRPRYFFRGDRVRVGRIYGHVAATAPLFAASTAQLAAHMVRHRPAAVISDFEPLSVYAALAVRPRVKIPVIAMSNQSLFRHAAPAASSAADSLKLAMLRAQVSSMVPHADRQLVIHFARPAALAGDARWAPPPVRDAVAARAGEVRRADGPVVVYLGHRSPDALHDCLRATGLELVVYGAAEEHIREGIAYRTFEEASYLDDLARAPFVLNTAGHSSIVDALALGVPVLAYPAAGHFEQELNARALEALGCGGHLTAADPRAIRNFAWRAERMAPARLGLPDNPGFFRALDGALAEVVPA